METLLYFVGGLGLVWVIGMLNKFSTNPEGTAAELSHSMAELIKQHRTK